MMQRTVSRDEQPFIHALELNPQDESQRLIFSDWLEEQGDPRGELTRLVYELTQSIDVSNRIEKEDRLRDLLKQGTKPIGPYWTNSISIEFAWIPPGIFRMGSPAHEEGRHPHEIEHLVKLTQGFFMGVHPVTQENWRAVMGDDPSHFKGEPTLPVEQVSWHESIQFLEKLKKMDQKPYRLPTEAEWEYACRAGTTTPYTFGTSITTDQTNYGGDPNSSIRKTKPSQLHAPNAFGIVDMHGNVSEWCQDWYGKYPTGTVVNPVGLNTGVRKVLRGGSWLLGPRYCRSASRSMENPETMGVHTGFRICFSIR